MQIVDVVNKMKNIQATRRHIRKAKKNKNEKQHRSDLEVRPTGTLGHYRVKSCQSVTVTHVNVNKIPVARGIP